MVGRIRDKKGIDIFPEYDFYNPTPLDDIKYENFINSKNDEYIFILAHRPGLGKTYHILEFLKTQIQKNKDFSFFYFTERHSQIREITKDWKEGTFSHWMGFDKLCMNARMKNLYKWHLWPEDICEKCTDKCGVYTSQFDNDLRVFAPFSYMNSKHFTDKKTPPDIVIVDENPKNFTIYSLDKNKAVKIFESLQFNHIANLVDNKNWETLIEKYPYHKTYFEYKKKILELAKDKGGNKKLLESIEKFDIYNFFQYIHWENLYKYNFKSYGVPTHYYNAFDAVTKGIPVVFLDATFNPNYFSYLLESYNGEMKHQGKKGFSNLVVSGFREDIEDVVIKSTIYRMNPEDSMPKSSFTDDRKWIHTKDNWLTAHMKLIMKVFGRDYVGIITYKDLADFPKTVGYDFEYYGNLRGTNILEDKPVLVIIGSYLPVVPSWIAKKKGTYNSKDKYFEDILRECFLLDVNEENLISVGVEAPKFVSDKYDYSLAKVYSYKYIGETEEMIETPGDIIASRPSEMLVNLMWYDEIYQAFHRNRPLREKRIIFSYCWFPEPDARVFETNSEGNFTNNVVDKLSLLNYNIREEFKDIRKVKNDNDKIIELFQYLSESDYGKGGLIEDIVNEIYLNSDRISSDITKKYHFQHTYIDKKGKKQRGAFTQPITNIIEGIKLLKEEAKTIGIKERMNERFSP